MVLRVGIILSFLFSGFFSHAQRLFETQIDVKAGRGTDKRDAVIYLPPHYSKSKAYPLVVFTHGMGEAGKNVKKLYKQGLPKVLKGGYRPPFDFIMVAVQRNSFSVAPEWLAGILEDCQQKWKIDASRIYLTGLSAGGWAAYGSQLNFSPAFAKKFAAIVINSGVTQNTNKKHFDWWKETKTPLWAIVGAADKGYVGKNAYMVNQINKRVPSLAKLTVRPGVGHGGWSDVYKGKVKRDGKNMWEWMYQFKRTTKGSSGGTKPPAAEAPPIPEKPEEAPLPTTPEKPVETPVPATVTDYIKVNIFKGYHAYNNAAWNNWNIGAYETRNARAENFKYADGKRSGIRATLSNSFRVVDNMPSYGSGMAPAAVLRFSSYAMAPRTLVITGLSATKTYAITLYGSRRGRPGNATIFSINNETRKVATNNNFTNEATFTNLKPNSKGQIVVTIKSQHEYNYLNGFILTEKGTKTGK